MCLGGYVGVFKYDDDDRRWKAQMKVSAESRGAGVVSIDTAEFSYWAAVSTPPCCDYEGYQLHLNPETLHPIPYFLEP